VGTPQTRPCFSFQHISNGVVVFAVREGGYDFVVRDINPAAERVEGVARAGLTGPSITALSTDGICAGLIDPLQRVWQSGVAECLPAVRCKTADGGRWYKTDV
jgi:hypothetical protein